MKPLPVPKLASRQKGMLLIEVMVALLLFLVGILGLVKTMAMTQVAQTDAQFRTEAASLANEIVQTISLTAARGTTAAMFNTALQLYQHNPSQTADCAFSGAVSANSDVAAWTTKVQTNTTGLPGATAAMQQILVGNTATDFNRITVTLCWKSPNDRVARQHVFASYINENF